MYLKIHLLFLRDVKFEDVKEKMKKFIILKAIQRIEIPVFLLSRCK